MTNVNIYSVTLHGSFGCRSLARLSTLETMQCAAAVARDELTAEGHKVIGVHIHRVFSCIEDCMAWEWSVEAARMAA